MKSLAKIAPPLALLALANPTMAEQEWGTLKGRFLVEGTAPQPAKVVVEKDAFCKHAKPVDQSVVVGKEGGLANVVVYLRPPRGGSVAVHPDLEKSADQPVEMANKGCLFTPRITLLRTGQELVVKNSDPTAHNTKFDLVKNEALNSVIAAKKEITTSFEIAETLPLPVSCSIHPFMQGFVLIRDDPYMTVTGEDGSFEIKNLPAGEHQFQFWHESGYLKNVVFDSGAADRRGRVRLTVPAGGELDLGAIKTPAELLSR